MRDNHKTFWFGIKIVFFILAIALSSGLIILFLTKHPPEKVDYYRISRLNFYGKVQQTYYSKGRPYGLDYGLGYLEFREYPSGKYIRFKPVYITIESLGTNPPVTR